MAGKKVPSFEEALNELEEIVAQMESGEPTLEALTKQYSRGLQLVAQCSAALSAAEQAMDLKITDKTDGTAEQLVLVPEGE